MQQAALAAAVAEPGGPADDFYMFLFTHFKEQLKESKDKNERLQQALAAKDTKLKQALDAKKAKHKQALAAKDTKLKQALAAKDAELTKALDAKDAAFRQMFDEQASEFEERLNADVQGVGRPDAEGLEAAGQR
eukprot:m51a1_g3599 hypothetical protein (134) ;mRNA; f:3347-6280